MSHASLALYDQPVVRAATDAWWTGLARAFGRAGVRDVPPKLERDRDLFEMCRAPDLLFAQLCGYPLMRECAGQVTLVATPVYAGLAHAGGTYRSLILVRADDPAQTPEDLRGRRAVFNGEDSQSGYSALRAVFAPLARDGRFFSAALCSGAHVNSMAMVVGGEADVCACDTILYELIRRQSPDITAGLRCLAESPITPCPAYVTRGDAAPDFVARLREGLRAALEDPDLAAVRDELMIAGAVERPLADYERIMEIEEEARRIGYPAVA